MASKYRHSQDANKDEQELVQEAKKTHKQTTNRLQNIKNITDETSEMAQATNEELEKQGEQLNLVQGDVEGLKDSNKKAKKIVGYLKLPCLCQCCLDCCDKEDKEYEPKKSPIIEMQQQDNVPPSQQKMMNKDQRSDGQKGNKKPTGYAGRPQNGKKRVGNLEGEDQQELDQETDQQEDILDDISKGIARLNDQAKNQKKILDYQNEQLDNLDPAVQNIKKDVTNNKTDIRRILG